MDGAQGSTEPLLTISYNSYPDSASGRYIVPPAGCTAGAGRGWVNTTTPTLKATVSDPDGGNVYGDFDVWTVGGTSSLWSGNSAAVTSGAQAVKAVPAGTLTTGGAYQWRVSGYDGALNSKNWTSFCEFGVDTVKPTVPTISSAQWAKDDWSSPTSGSFTWSSPSTDVTSWSWWLDAGTPTTVAASTTTATLNNVPAGWHTFHVKATDRAGNTSQTDYAFAAGDGSLVSPVSGDRTDKGVSLSVAAPSDKTHLSYRYRIGTTGTFVDIPAGDVTDADDAPVAGWPIGRSGSDFPDLDWDLTRTLTADWLVEVQACFHTSASDPNPMCTAAADVTLVRSAFGGSYGTADLGPGQVSLATGDVKVDHTDVAIAGLSLSRTHTTLLPATATTGAEGVFGPGWTASLPADAGAADYTLEDHTGDGYVLLVGPDGETLTYTSDPTADPDAFTGKGDAADGSVLTKTSATVFTLTDPDGTITTFTQSAGAWTVDTVNEPGKDNDTQYDYDSEGRPTRMLAPVPSDVTCPLTGAMGKGCRALEFTYATTPTDGLSNTVWGDYTGRLTQVDYTAWDPIAEAMATVTVARYSYDNLGRLRAAWDPRISPALKTTYDYESFTDAGVTRHRVTTVTPPGLNPWTFAYDSQGRLTHVARLDPAHGPATQAIAYNLPPSGPGLPTLTGTAAATWGQTVDLPIIGAALFPASHLPPRDTATGAYTPGAGDWEYAALTYLDVNGRPVNTASFGAGAWQIDATRYDQHGNEVWRLDAGNRAQALSPTGDTDPHVAAQTSSADRADLLATVSTYTADGAELLTTTGPTHPLLLDSGATASARQLTTHAYDQGRPDPDQDYHLTTTTTVEPLVVAGPAATAADTRTTKTGYDPIDGADPTGPTSGWTLRAPTTQTTVMPGGTDLVTRTRYDAAGWVVESRMPGSPGGGDAGTTLTTHYTAAAGDPTCGDKAEFAGLACRTAPAAQPAGQTIPTTVTGYDRFGQPATVTETSGTVTRTSTTTYEAGRVKTVAVTVTGLASTAVPTQTYDYNVSTGLPETLTAGGDTIKTEYDDLGRVTSYTDADGNTATTTYDIDSRPKTINDGRGTYSYTYDGTDAAGNRERRGLVTALDVGLPTGSDVFAAAYDPAGALVRQDYPNGLTATTSVDNAGETTALTYAKASTPWLAFTQTANVHGQTVTATSPSSGQTYTYDHAGRLTQVADTTPGACSTRAYGFTPNSNRDRYWESTGAQCPTPPAPLPTTAQFDTADRADDTGYRYDELGRTLEAPAAAVAGDKNLAVGYHADDMVDTLTEIDPATQQPNATKTFTLDPARRLRLATDTTGGTETRRLVNHFADPGDAPAWISESTTAGTTWTWTRNVLGITGDLALTHGATGTAAIQLTNPHGDVVATATNDPAAVGTTAYFEQTEYGTPRASNPVNPDRYGWLGAKRRSADALGGLTLMGVRLYNPGTGRFLSIDPVVGGNANAYSYPVNPVDSFDLDGRICGCANGRLGVFPRGLLREGFRNAAPYRTIASGRGVHVRASLARRYGLSKGGWSKLTSRSYTSASGRYRYEAHWYSHVKRPGVKFELKIKAYYRLPIGKWVEI